MRPLEGFALAHCPGARTLARGYSDCSGSGTAARRRGTAWPAVTRARPGAWGWLDFWATPGGNGPTRGDSQPSEALLGPSQALLSTWSSSGLAHLTLAPPPVPSPATAASRESILGIARSRTGWLIAFCIGLLVAALVVEQFEDVLERHVELSFFVPLIMGHGGNTGSQAVTTVIRCAGAGADHTTHRLACVVRAGRAGGGQARIDQHAGSSPPRGAASRCSQQARRGAAERLPATPPPLPVLSPCRGALAPLGPAAAPPSLSYPQPPRALALKQITSKDAPRVILKEAGAGCLMGAPAGAARAPTQASWGRPAGRRGAGAARGRRPACGCGPRRPRASACAPASRAPSNPLFFRPPLHSRAPRPCLTGALLGLAILGASFAWDGISTQVGATVAVALPLVSLWANGLGAALTLLADRLKLDPAVTSVPAMTTIIDSTGLIVYFHVARWMLDI
jgi:cation transporter-like permease